ncbi:hypothetical protein V1281_004705 [Nitrobacteraceae bacterium AZCC 2161]
MTNFIDLRWTLRDIRSNRQWLLPLNSEHVRELVERGFIELRDDIPVITEAGLVELDRSGA